MTPEKVVWLFHGERSRFSSAVFSTRTKAEEWIRREKLTGVLTQYTVDAECQDLEFRSAPENMQAENLAARRMDSGFVASFTFADHEHYHYEEGSM